MLEPNPNARRRHAPRLDLVPSGPLRRVAKRFGDGAEQWGRDVWRAGLDVDDALNHATVHLQDYADRLRRFRAGERPDPRLEEDDLAAVGWAALVLMEYQDREKR